MNGMKDRVMRHARAAAAIAATMAAIGARAVPAMAEVPDVAADIAPVHSLAARVMDGIGTPDLIIRPGASPHDYALRPSEAAALQRADVVFHVGAALTPWLEGALDGLAGQAVKIELLDVKGTRLLMFRDADGHDDEHATGLDEDGHEDGHDDGKDEGHDEAGHDHGAHEGHVHEGLDPHAWLDPENARLWLSAMAEVLSEADPENAERYAANARDGAAEITAAQDAARALLEPVRDKPFVVFHDAYQYFEQSFGLHSAGAISPGDAAAPGPRRVARIRDLARARGVTCVFSEPQFRPELVETVFEGSKVHMAMLDPLGAGLTPGPALYPDLIRELAADMAACLGE